MSGPYYGVIDLQKTSFMDYTYDENWTKEDIRVHLLELINDGHDESDKLPQDYKLEHLLEIYELDLEEKTDV